MIKLVAVDLDGTLLRTDKTISARSVAVLAGCRQRGIKVVCATGRGGSAAALAPPQMFDGRVLMNGAMAYEGDQLVYRRLVEMDTARALLVACDERGLKTSAERDGVHYSNFVVSDEWSEVTNYRMVDFRQHRPAAEKLYAIVRDADDVAFIQARVPQGLYLTVSRDNLAQVMHTEATKSNAIAALAGRWGIRAEEITAFGDDLNDTDMLQGFGAGVAMGNAVEAVKAIADAVCETNDNDGVARWLLAHTGPLPGC